MLEEPAGPRGSRTVLGLHPSAGAVIIYWGAEIPPPHPCTPPAPRRPIKHDTQDALYGRIHFYDTLL